MAEQPPQALRIDAQTLQTFLDRLDRQAHSPRGLDRRAAERFAYRAAGVTAELTRGDEPRATCAVATRNISRSGIALLAGQFIYPGTSCTLRLPTQHGSPQTVRGRAVRCRYIVTSATLHEVGVRFERPIDVELFAEQARRLRILLVDPSPGTQRLIAGFSAPRRTKLDWIPMAVDAAAAALSSDYDLILIDLDSPALDAFVLIRELRRAAYLGPIVGLAVDTGRTLETRCREVGCTGFVPKPMTRSALHALLDSLAVEPVLSSLADDPRLAPLINAFVAGLRTRVKQLALALEAGDLPEVHRLARDLRADAGSYGFEVITEQAEHVQALAGLEARTARLRAAIYELTHLCLAARPVCDDLPAENPTPSAARPHEADLRWE